MEGPKRLGRFNSGAVCVFFFAPPPLLSFPRCSLPLYTFSFVLGSYTPLVLIHQLCIFGLSQCEGFVFVFTTRLSLPSGTEVHTVTPTDR